MGIKNEQADCIYIEQINGKENKLKVIKKEIANVKMVKIQQLVCEKRKGFSAIAERRAKRKKQQLQKIIKKHCGENTIVVTNEQIVKEWNLPNLSFEARKQEWMDYQKEILQYFQGKPSAQKNDRKTFLLVLDSVCWTQKDIMNILLEIKNYYEDVYIVLQTTIVDIEQITEAIFDECGLVLHVLQQDAAKQKKVEAALFLLGQWDEGVKEYSFGDGYVVAEWEHGLHRLRKNLCVQSGNGQLYAGFVYEKENYPIPYDLAVALTHSYMFRRNQIKQEFRISIVAIYGVE